MRGLLLFSAAGKKVNLLLPLKEKWDSGGEITESSDFTASSCLNMSQLMKKTNAIRLVGPTKSLSSITETDAWTLLLFCEQDGTHFASKILCSSKENTRQLWSCRTCRIFICLKRHDTSRTPTLLIQSEFSGHKARTTLLLLIMTELKWHRGFFPHGKHMNALLCFQWSNQACAGSHRWKPPRSETFLHNHNVL